MNVYNMYDKLHYKSELPDMSKIRTKDPQKILKSGKHNFNVFIDDDNKDDLYAEK
jgi:hypothetical protein